MGTNYHAKINVCEHCDKPEDEIHLGKSSVGWRFMIELNEEYYKDYKSFIKFIKSDNVVITTEYNKEVSPEKLINLMESKKKDKSHIDNYPDAGFKDNGVDVCEGGFS